MKDKYIYFGWFNRTYFPGASIDLKYCLTKVNYKETWRAYDDMPRKIEDIYYSGPKKYRKEDHTYSEPDVKQILSIHKPTGNTEPNATVVGSPTITDNVVSGISLGNFLTMPEVFNPGANSWEIVIRAKTAATRSHRDWLIGSGNTAGQDCGYITMGLENNGKPLLYLSSNGSSWNIASAVAGSTILDTDTYYLFRLRFIRVGMTGAVYIYDISSDNGQSWKEEIRINNTYSIFVPTIPYAIGISYYSRSPNEFWAGSIDFSQSYIKINGKYWWKGTKPEYDLLYNKSISLLKAEDFNSIKESSSGVAIWGGDAISTGSQGGGIQNLKQRDSITFNKSLPAGKYTVVFNYYSQVNFTMVLVQFTATYEDGTTEVVYSNTSLGDTAYGGGEKADVTTTMTFNKRIKGITTLAQGSGGGNGCYGGFGKIRMSLSGAQQ